MSWTHCSSLQFEWSQQVSKNVVKKYLVRVQLAGPFAHSGSFLVPPVNGAGYWFSVVSAHLCRVPDVPHLHHVATMLPPSATPVPGWQWGQLFKLQTVKDWLPERYDCLLLLLAPFDSVLLRLLLFNTCVFLFTSRSPISSLLCSVFFSVLDLVHFYAHFVRLDPEQPNRSIPCVKQNSCGIQVLVYLCPL